MTTDPQWATLAQTLASIDASLKTIADFVTLLHTEKTGEKITEVQRYVVGADGDGQPCIWLYGTHPALEYAVTRVYHDHLSKLPYPVNPAAKVWDGEQAPSVEAAAKKGYFNAFPAPFSISLMPTGKTTDAGHPVRRLHRVLDAPPAGAAAAPTARPNPANGNGNGKPPARPIQPPEPPPWEEFEDEFERMPPAAREPEQAAALAKAAAAAPKASLPAIAAQPDRAQLARIHELIDSKGARFSGAASKEQYGLLRRLVDSHTNGNKQAAYLLIARMVGSEVARVERPDWLPPAAACAGVIDFLAHRLPSGDLVRPLELDPARKADLAVILGAAWKAAGLAGEPDLSEKIPF